MLITSRSNPTVKKLIALQQKKYRAAYGEYLAEGEKMVSECMASGGEITLLVFSESAQSRLSSDAGNVLLKASMPVIILSDDLFEKVSGEKTPQGVMAVVRLPDGAVQPPEKSCLLLDGVSDPGNLGAIVRTANAAGYEEIYLIGCADPYSPKAVRASMSGVFHTKLYIGAEEEILSALAGVPLVAADLDGQNVFSFVPPDKFCLVIGNEGHGIGAAVKSLAAYTVTIPMRRTQESLNAAVSAGIVMYALKRGDFEKTTEHNL